MSKTQTQKTFRWQAYKPLLAAAFAVAGVFNMVGAVMAAGTLATTAITNTATANYQDDQGTPINAVSNTVIITVAEVAGLVVTPGVVTDSNGGSLVGGDTVFYDYTVANTGNASTYVFLPGPSNVGVTNGTVTRVDIIDAGGNVLGNIPNGGLTTQNLGTVPGSGLIPVNGSFTVRVTVTADTLTVPTGQFVTVQFGNTTDNTIAPAANGTQNQQNIPDDTDGAPNPTDVRTLNEGTLTPVNGEREAANTSQLGYNQASVTLAQALLLKTSAYSNSSTPANPTDDKIVYNLELRVGNQIFPSVNPGRLEGTPINLDTGSGATPTNRILVSDAIPANTEFDPTQPTASPNPTNWTVVYSQSPLTINAKDAVWETNLPPAARITRVGFIYDSTANGSIAPSTVLPGFSFGVTTNGLVAPGGSIANIAQIFGETEGDTVNNLVFDESGDQNLNNLNDGVTPTTRTTTFVPLVDFGVGNVADPENTLNANDGTGPKGESNVVNVATLPPVTGSLFNGPENTPTATGPTNTNDDFTNVTATVPTVTAPGTPVNPNAVTITNQVNNPNATRLDTVKLLPLAPSAALTASGGAGVFGSDSNIADDLELPDGTLVTIIFGGQTAVYEYTSGAAGPGGASGFHTPGNINTVPTAVEIGTLQPAGQAGSDQKYDVTIDLPGTAQQVAGYGVPIIAFVDNNGNGTYEDGPERATSNITINRAYTGFMKLRKEARVVFAPRDGATLASTPFSSDPTALAAIPLRPGDIIEYLITYTNISEAAPAGGGGNVLLNARNFKVTENGATGGNTWAANTIHRTTTAASAGSVAYTVGAAAPTGTEPADITADVNQYENTVGTVAPSPSPNTPSGTLLFRRQVK